MARFREVGSVNLVSQHVRRDISPFRQPEYLSKASAIKNAKRVGKAGKAVGKTGVFVGGKAYGGLKTGAKYSHVHIKDGQSTTDDGSDTIKSILSQFGSRRAADGVHLSTSASKFVARTGWKGVKKAGSSAGRAMKRNMRVAKQQGRRTAANTSVGKTRASFVNRSAEAVTKVTMAVMQRVAAALASATTPIIMAIVSVVVSLMALVSIFPSWITGMYLEEQKKSELSVNVPPQYAKYVLDAGSICPEVTPSIIAAQIDTESGWNPRAQSPVGAQGISQFMPGTWASVGRDGNGDGKADPFDPADAIISQGHYMCGQVDALKRHGLSGSIDLALAAYNAGLGNVLTFHGIPPFAETQNYVKRIKELAATKYAVVSAGSVGGAGDDYPWKDLVRDAAGNVTGVYNTPNYETRYYFGNCTDFVFWRVNRDMGVTYQGKETQWHYTYPFLTPAGGNGGQWGDPGNMPGWGTVRAPEQAKPGDVISFKPGAFGSSAQFGHVAYVSSVAPDGTITTENYGGGEYFVRVLPENQLRPMMNTGRVVIRHNPALGG
ncbi:transglycosylase SLT domain-containing protein [Arcanobacterium phocisimile]|uniref:Transglycosylase SLT domain-containing protein n=1 Tax=Arcanobacterium phocisimile TaxID=1302235 RepID=A0ABX7IG04_9ACTO|nr:transglycosylase SLT domain-containing protein [Arcanobacterium phocisimile]QRV02068.1 transglycosylase SLT domain-containing protein [Arcanobacterium phocisimile]